MARMVSCVSGRYTGCMPAQLLSGKEPADAILESLKDDVEKLDPKLVIVQVGSDPASDSYIRKKMESCERIGLRSEHRKLPEKTSKEEMIALVHELNEDPDVTGYIIQLPLSKELMKHTPQIFREIDPYKDVDGFTAYNLGKMFISTEFEHLPPATPAGIIALLDYYKIDVKGKHAVVVGHSNIVGKPLSVMLLNRGATVTVCHENTTDLPGHTKRADILVSAVGKAGLITKDMIKKDSVLIDVGMNWQGTSVVGDIDAGADMASGITPVPGGVGPMTVACLLRNCVTAAKRQHDRVLSS